MTLPLDDNFIKPKIIKKGTKKKITANKYEKHYNKISYKKTFYGFFSLFGFCSGVYFGYNSIKA